MVRPFRVPLPWWGCAAMLTPASLLLLALIAMPVLRADVQARRRVDYRVVEFFVKNVGVYALLLLLALIAMLVLRADVQACGRVGRRVIGVFWLRAQSRVFLLLLALAPILRRHACVLTGSACVL